MNWLDSKKPTEELRQNIRKYLINTKKVGEEEQTNKKTQMI